MCAELVCPPGADRPTGVLHETLARVGKRIVELGRVADQLELSELYGPDALGVLLVAPTPT